VALRIISFLVQVTPFQRSDDRSRSTVYPVETKTGAIGSEKQVGAILPTAKDLIAWSSVYPEFQIQTFGTFSFSDVGIKLRCDKTYCRSMCSSL
jgi:hypothetical protein